MVRGNNPNSMTLLDHLPGWLFLLGGFMLMALSTLMPLHREVEQLDRRLALMHMQQSQLDHQASDYREFYHALRTDDPTVLQRLAYYHLRLKPRGVQPLDHVGPGRGDTSPTIEMLLHRPLPAGRFEPKPQPSSRLNRITSGSKRLGLLAIGVMCVYVGLLMPLRHHDADDDQAA
jgi:hypothetical protein